MYIQKYTCTNGSLITTNARQRTKVELRGQIEASIICRPAWYHLSEAVFRTHVQAHLQVAALQACVHADLLQHAAAKNLFFHSDPSKNKSKDDVICEGNHGRYLIESYRVYMQPVCTDLQTISSYLHLSAIYQQLSAPICNPSAAICTSRQLICTYLQRTCTYLLLL